MINKSKETGVKSDFYDNEYASFHKELFIKMKSGDSDESVQTRERVETIISLAGDVKFKNVLDIGTGVGLFAFAFSKKGARIVGIDSSGMMLRAAYEIQKEEQIDYFGLVQAVAPVFPFVKNSFDIINIGDVVEHLVPNILGQTLKSCNYLLTPTGKLVIHTSPGKHHYLLLTSRIYFYCALPFLSLPFSGIITEYYLDLLYNLYILYRKVINNKQLYGVDEHGHINCQTVRGITKQLNKSGFNISTLFTKEIFVRNKNIFNKFPFLLVSPQNRHYLHRSIFIVAVHKK